MIIVVEGPDGSGKSTLIETMRRSKLFPAHFLGSSGPPISSTLIWSELRWLNQMPPGLTLVMDRHRLISERIYGKILRGVSMLEPLDLIESLVSASVDQYVYCRPPIRQIEKNIFACPQLKGVHDHIGEIIHEYDQIYNVIKDSKIRGALYDYTVHNAREFIQRNILQRDLFHE